MVRRAIWRNSAQLGAILSRSIRPLRYLALKNWFFFYPVAIVLLFLVTLTFIFAYAVHAAELHAPDEDGEEVRDLGDAVWLVLISMTTVGFGEVVPHTAAGKAFAAAATIIGMLLTAIVISVVHSQLALTYQQAYALKALQRDVLLKSIIFNE